MTNKMVILRLPEVLERSRSWSIGVVEFWGIKKRYQSFSHYSNTPVLQHSEINSNL
jgi:hypothetical protein